MRAKACLWLTDELYIYLYSERLGVCDMRSVRRQSGFTLVEVMIATAILAFAVAAVSQAIVAGQMQTYEALHNWRGLCLAEAMVEEIISLPYDDPDGGGGAGPEAGEPNRNQFDNCDDFHGYSETAGNVDDAAGNGYGDMFDRFSRAVTATYTQQAVPGMGAPQDGLQVTVTVTDDRGLTWSIVRFITEPAS